MDAMLRDNLKPSVFKSFSLFKVCDKPAYISAPAVNMTAVSQAAFHADRTGFSNLNFNKDGKPGLWSS